MVALEIMHFLHYMDNEQFDSHEKKLSRCAGEVK